MADLEKAFLDIIDNRMQKYVNAATSSFIKQRLAVVIDVNEDTNKAFVYFIDDERQTRYSFYNKSGENLEEGDTVKVFYTTNVAKGWIGARSGEVNKKKDIIPYISAKVQNEQAITYDKIDRNLLSVDFRVDDTDSDVVFTANQMCNVNTDGELNIYYKIDGTTQDYKPTELLSIGKRIVSHVYPMTLNIGNHNFAVYVVSPNGKGTTKAGDLIGVLSGQISGLKTVLPPNENFLIYLNGVPAETEIKFPQMYQDKGGTIIVDWGDDSAPEESAESGAIQHTYINGGDYVITIKSNNTSMISGTSELSYKSYVTAVYYPDGVDYINHGTLWKDCPNLETVYLGKSLTQLRSLSLENDAKITTLIFPDTITQLDVGLKNTGVLSLTIPRKVTYYGNDFSGISSLTRIEFKNGILNTCRSDSNLNTVIMSDNITEIPQLCFSYCSKLKNINFSQKITTIESSAFSNSGIEEVPLLPNLTTIGISAFANCSSLANVVLGNKVTFIGSSAFKQCVALTNMNLSQSLQKIDSQAFYQTPVQFTKDDFPPTLTNVGEMAFKQSGVKSVKIVPNCTYGNQAFYECKALTEAEIGNGVTVISQSCFVNCTSLGKVYIPSSVIEIKQNAFDSCGISVLTLAEGVQTIGSQAFRYCTNLTGVSVPSTAVDIASGVFSNCSALLSVSFADGLNKVSGSMFSNCSSLNDLDLGTVTQIEGSAFSSCKNLRVLNLNYNTTIASSAFNNCGFTTLSLLPFLAVLPNDATTTYGGKYNIGGRAFYNCVSLTEVDGLTYKFSVGLKKTEQSREKASDPWGEPVVTDLGLMQEGIYGRMGATEDSVFANTKLKEVSVYLSEHTEYENISTTTYKCTYTAYKYGV